METREVYLLKLKNITYNSALYISPKYGFDISKTDTLTVDFNTFETESYSIIAKNCFCDKEYTLWFIDKYKNAILDFISNYNKYSFAENPNFIISDKLCLFYK